jgi:gamma-polyglutamate synthase
MGALAISLGGVALLLVYLAIERVRHKKALGRIPLRIAVTGTRGKSSVTRLIAAIARESGRRVVAKTTGSKPVVILPDGRENEIVRTGTPSILEQKKLIKLASRLKADALVVETMSIRPENLRAESAKLIRPHILALTNVRLDHMDDMGQTKEAIAASLAGAIPADGTLVVLEEEDFAVFHDVAAKKRATVVRVPKKPELEAGGDFEFVENVRLALAVADVLKIPRETALRGMAVAQPDFGSLKIWATERLGRTWHLASAFAANEPESTARVLAMIRCRPDLPSRSVALLNLRPDRGDRTRQWLAAVRGGFFDGFDHLVFVGEHARALSRKSTAWFGTKAHVATVAGRDPAKIMDRVFALVPEGGLVVGMGNMGGPGEALVGYWNRIGRVA